MNTVFCFYQHVIQFLSWKLGFVLVGGQGWTFLMDIQLWFKMSTTVVTRTSVKTVQVESPQGEGHLYQCPIAV